MPELPWIFITIASALLIAFLVTIFVMRRKGVKTTANYRGLFIIGIALGVVGISGHNPPIVGLGLIYMIVSLINRKKWKDQPKWSELSPTERKLKLALLIVLGVLLIAGVAMYFLYR